MGGLRGWSDARRVSFLVKQQAQHGQFSVFSAIWTNTNFGFQKLQIYAKDLKRIKQSNPAK